MFLRARWPGTLSSLAVFWGSRCPNGLFLSSQGTVVELLASPEVEGSPEVQNSGLRAPGDAGNRRFVCQVAGKSVKFGGFLGFLVSKQPLPELLGHRCGALGFTFELGRAFLGARISVKNSFSRPSRLARKGFRFLDGRVSEDLRPTRLRALFVTRTSPRT